MANLLGAGVQAIYRGPRLFDTSETKAMVQRMVAFTNPAAPFLILILCTFAGRTAATGMVFST